MAIETIDLTGDGPSSLDRPAKRQRVADPREDVPSRHGQRKAIDLTRDDVEEDFDAPPKKKKAKKAKEDAGEKRLKRYAFVVALLRC